MTPSLRPIIRANYPLALYETIPTISLRLFTCLLND